MRIAGTVDEKKLSWQHDAEYNYIPFTLIYAGTLDDSGKMGGTVHRKPEKINVSQKMMATNDHALSGDGKQIAITGITRRCRRAILAGFLIGVEIL